MDGHLHRHRDHPHAMARRGRADAASLTAGNPAAPADLNRLALSATLHCSTGCGGIGEALGMVLGTALDWATCPPSPFWRR